MFEIERLEITRLLQTVTADRARRPWESRNLVRACAVSLSTSLSARYLSFNLLLLCVVVLYRCKLNCLFANPAKCEIRAVIGILNGKKKDLLQPKFLALVFCLLANNNECDSVLDN